MEIAFAVFMVLFLGMSIELKRRNSVVRGMVQSILNRKLNQLKALGKYDEIAAYYRKKAFRSPQHAFKENYLGLAALCEFKCDEAVSRLEAAAKASIGTDNAKIQNNLAVAYLQKGWYSHALNLLENLRKSGGVQRTTYIIALLANSRYEEARTFYSGHFARSKDNTDLSALLGFSPSNPDTLEDAKGVLERTGLWIYKPVLQDLILDFEWEISKQQEDGDCRLAVERYRRRAACAKELYNHDNYLGLAALMDHDPDSAMRYFKKAAMAATGSNLKTIRSNLAKAYLQKGWYADALDLLEELRNEGYVPIESYVVILLLYGRYDEARAFYAQHPIKDDLNEGMEALLRCSPADTASIEAIRGLVGKKGFWILKPAIEELINRTEDKAFFSRTDRYEALRTQGKELLFRVKNDPGLFSGIKTRYMRYLLTTLIPRVGSYRECAALWGMIQNLHAFSEELDLEDDLGKELSQFWRHVYYTFWNTTSAETYNPYEEGQLIRDQLPEDAKPLISESSRCSLFFSESLQYGVRSSQVEQSNGFIYFYVDLITEAKVKAIMSDAATVMEIMKEDKDAASILEPLLYRLVSDNESVHINYLVNILNQLPGEYGDRLAGLKNRLEQDSTRE